LAYMSSQLTNTIFEAGRRHHETSKRIDAANEYLRRHKISSILAGSVRQNLRKETFNNQNTAGEEDFLSHLPRSLRNDLLVEARQGYCAAVLPFLVVKKYMHAGSKRCVVTRYTAKIILQMMGFSLWAKCANACYSLQVALSSI